MIINYITSIIIGYLCGCIQTSYLIGKLFKNIDIRKHGTKNAGGSNAVVVFGWAIGAFTVLFDILKATLAVYIVLDYLNLGVTSAFLSGIAAVLGHIHPFFMGFKGGKGFGSYVGMLIGFNPIFGISVFLGASLFTMITNYVALGTVIVVALCPIIVHLFPNVISNDVVPIEVLLALILISCYIIFKHLKNLRQIFITKDEITFWSVVLKKK